MTARGKVVESLDALQQSFSQLSFSQQPNESDGAGLSNIRLDLVSLSEHLSKESTNLAIALRPPVSLDASQACIDKIKDYYRKVAYLHSILSRTDEQHQLTWANELKQTSARVIESVKQCAPLWKKGAASSTTTADRKALLEQTARIWDQTARMRESLSMTNREAHGKVWKDQLDLVGDAVRQAEEEDDGEQGMVEMVRVARSVLVQLCDGMSDDQDLETLTDTVKQVSPAVDDLLDEEDDAAQRLRAVLNRIAPRITDGDKLNEALSKAFKEDNDHNNK